MAGDELIVRTAWRSLAAPASPAPGERSRVARRGAGPPPRAAPPVPHGRPRRLGAALDRPARRRPSDVPSLDVLRLAALYHDAVYDPRARRQRGTQCGPRGRRWRRGLGWPEADRARGPPTDPRHRRTRRRRRRCRRCRAARRRPRRARSRAGGVPRVRARGARPSTRTSTTRPGALGRPAVLRGFLDRPTIYATTPMRERHERRARANLTAEIASLAADRQCPSTVSGGSRSRSRTRRPSGRGADAAGDDEPARCADVGEHRQQAHRVDVPGGALGRGARLGSSGDGARTSRRRSGSGTRRAARAGAYPCGVVDWNA